MKDDINGEIEAAFDFIERCVYIRIAAVMSGASSATPTVPFSLDPEKEKRQVGFLWSQGSAQLFDLGLAIEPRPLLNQHCLPYRRRHRAANARDLRRVAELIDCLRVHLLEVLLSGELAACARSDEGIEVLERLFYSLATYDLPDVAALAEEHESIRRGLCDVLRVSSREFSAMQQVAAAGWSGLSSGVQSFGSFDRSRCTR